jgi:1-phosphofructokinase
MVFAPSPILTITIEKHADGTPEIHLHAGSQGFWVARMVARLRVPVTLCGPFGDDTGKVLRTLIASEGVDVHAVEMHGANGAYVHDRRGGERTELAQTSTVELSRHEIDDLYGATLIAGIDAQVTVLTGPTPGMQFPADFYRRLATDIRTNGGKVVADLSGEHLMAALEGGVDILKISHQEMIEEGYASGNDPLSVLEGMRDIIAKGAINVLVSRAADPAYACIEGDALKIIMPRLEPNEFRGSGDSMTAGLAVGLARNLPMDDVLRLAAAAGALNVTRSGLGTGHRDEIEQLSRRIDVLPLETEASD